MADSLARVATADTCACGDSLKAGEIRCEHCTSLGEHEARMAEIDDAIGDLLSATRCAMCPEEAGDREPPMLMGAPLCASCYAKAYAAEDCL